VPIENALDLEGLAEYVLQRTGCDDPPVDAFDLADLCRLKIRYVPGRDAKIEGRIIKLGGDESIRHTRVHGRIAHEIAHYVLARFKHPNTEPNARYLGAALLVPRRPLDRQLRRGWDLHALMARHLNASAELLARRIVDLRSNASLAIYDEGRFRYRVGHRDLKPSNESELAAEALETRSAIRVDDLTGAWPICDATHRRVLVLAA
jgi:hypothetical protein